MKVSPFTDQMTALRAGRVRLPDGRPVTIVQEYETHSARVFVTETHAFKIRKPVSLGFLDYSTEDKRREAGRTELMLGRRVSPQVHLGLWTLTSTESPILLPSEDSGEPVVAMNRLPEEFQLDLLFSDPRTPDWKLDAVASACARFHALCPVDTRIDGYGSPEKTTEAWAVNFEQLSATDATIPLTPSERQQLITETADWLKSHRDVLVQRISEGRIREGHGDLRLQHVYLTEPWSVIDPLEFSVDLRFCDVAAEIGFLAMELDAIGRHAASERLVKQYAEATQDHSLEAVIPFFKRYRAVVRAKVEWIRATQTTSTERAEHLSASRHLFVLALGYRIKREAGPSPISWTG